MRRTWIRLAVVPVAFAIAGCGVQHVRRRRLQRHASARHQRRDGHDGIRRDDDDRRRRGTDAPTTTKASGATTTTAAAGDHDDAPIDAGSRQRRVGDRVRGRGLRERGRRDAGRAQGVRRGQRDHGHLRRPARLRAADQRPGARRQPARHRRVPAARQAGPVRTDGDLLEVPADVVASVSENWADSYMAFSNVDGTQFGVPLKSDLKSLRVVHPERVGGEGLQVPTTLTEFKALMDEMIANGDTPLCVGIESGTATGWPFTDWVEEMVLREQGVDFYNQWVAHEVPFNDPPVVETFNEVAGPDGMWTKEGAVFAVGGSIAATAFGGTTPQPLVEGECMMHRQANFYCGELPGGHRVRRGPGQVSTFYFPSDEGHPVLVGGLQAGAFRDAPEVWKVMQYLGSAEYANARQRRRRHGWAVATPGSSPATATPTSACWSRARAGVPRDAEDRRPGGVRRLRPDAGRGRLGIVLDGGHLVRQRRRGRRDGDRRTSRARGRADAADAERAPRRRWCR